MSVLFGTGFEMGATEVCTGSNSLETTTVHTGVYSARLDYNGSLIISIDEQGEIYLSAWVYHSNTDDPRIYIRYDSTVLVELRHNGSSGAWDAYRSTSNLLASGTVPSTDDAWYNMQAHISIDDAAGVVETWIDGSQDIDFTGDTKPGSETTANSVRFFQNTAGVLYVDDVTVGDSAGGQIGDIRYDWVSPDGDDSVQWTPSAGSNYQCVDEVPYSDSDYVTSGSDGHKDVYTLGDWNGTAKTAQHVVSWVRAKKDAAGTRQLQHGLDSGGVEDEAALYDITTDYVYYDYVVEDDPDGGGDLTESVVDALKFVLESSAS